MGEGVSKIQKISRHLLWTALEEGERKDISPRERSTYPRYLDYLLMDHLQLSLRVGERDVRLLKRKVYF
jgi:hypothetical protein